MMTEKVGEKNWGFSIAGLGRASVYSAALCADQYCVKVTMVSTTPESTTLLARSRTHTQAESERKRLLLLASKGTLANKVWPATFVNVFFHFSSSLDPVFCLCVCVCLVFKISSFPDSRKLDESFSPPGRTNRLVDDF